MWRRCCGDTAPKRSPLNQTSRPSTFLTWGMESAHLLAMRELPQSLTIGFARRFAPYKRATLLFLDLQRAIELFSQKERPIQLLYAGKSHPANDDGKLLIQKIIEIGQSLINAPLDLLENVPEVLDQLQQHYKLIVARESQKQAPAVMV